MIFTGEKISAHPDKDEITERLLSGESVRSIAAWLRQKHSSNKRFWISYLTLQRFRQQHLQLHGKVLREIKETVQTVTAERVNEQRALSIQESKPYEAAKLQIASDVLGREQLILDLHDKVWQRIKMLENEDLNYKTETVIVQYISELRQLMGDYNKMLLDWTKIEKKTGDSQVNIQVIMQEAEQQVNLVKIVVKELLQDMQPELVPVFLDKLRTKLEEQQAIKSVSSGTIVNVQVNNHGN